MKITFDSENKTKGNFDFPKLYLDQNERARIVCIEAQPEVNYVHTLRAPSIINGQVVMEKVRNKDGSMSEKVKSEFVGKHLCFGNPNVLSEKEKDVDNCPTCAASQTNDCIEEPRRRFAMHVIQYKTKPGSHSIQDPFQAELVVWAFTDRVFNTLVDITTEHGDLRQRDLLLGPCENKMYQNFDIQVGGSAQWLATPENTDLVKRLYSQNKLDDLTPAIARKATREQVQEDIQKVIRLNAQAYGGGSEALTAPDWAQSGSDLDSLLSGDTPAPEATTPVSEADPTPVSSEPTVDLSVPDMNVDVAEVPAQTPAATSEVPEPAKEEPKKTLDFDSLLQGL